MFKKHPLTTLLDLLLIIISLCVLNNSVVIFFIVFFFLLKNSNSDHRCYCFILRTVVILSFLNILWGNLTTLLTIIIFIIYLIEITKDYSKIEWIRIYDSLFSSANKEVTSLYLQVIYFKDIFMTNYQKLHHMDHELGDLPNLRYYVYMLKRCLVETKKETTKIIATYERRLYFNRYRNKYKIKFTKEDIFLVFIHLLFVVVIFMLGRSPYAIFH